MILGVLGGIASGKSTVTHLLVEQGAEAIDADRVAHQVLQEPAIRGAIRAAFGDEVIGAGGEVDRQVVARLVFSDRRKLETLESILHPEIRRRIADRVEAFRARPGSERRVLVLDVPLLAESPALRALCDELVFVETPVEARRHRTEARGWSSGELERREAHQQSIEEKRRLAGATIANSGSLEDLRRQVERLYHGLVGAED